MLIGKLVPVDVITGNDVLLFSEAILKALDRPGWLRALHCLIWHAGDKICRHSGLKWTVQAMDKLERQLGLGDTDLRSREEGMDEAREFAPVSYPLSPVRYGELLLIRHCHWTENSIHVHFLSRTAAGEDKQVNWNRWMLIGDAHHS